MTAVVYRLRSDLRRGWRWVALITLLVGLSGGATLAGLAAARRTDTAFARMPANTDAWDLTINPNNGSDSRLTMDMLRGLPGIDRIARADGVLLYPSFASSLADLVELPAIVVSEGDAGYAVGRPVPTAGHLPAANDPNGVFVDRGFAQRLGLHVGELFHYVLMTPDLFQQLQTVPPAAAGATALQIAPASQQGDARIEGIGVGQDGVVINPGYAPSGLVFTPAFRASHPDLWSPYWVALVKLQPGVDLDAFTARVRAMVPDESVAFQRASAVSADVKNATDPEVMALEAFAGLAALLGLVVVGQALSRRMQLDAASNATLAALGSTRRELMVVALAKAEIAVAAGAVLAVAIAVAASPLGPVGPVRVAEVNPGVAFDWPVLVIGGMAILLAGLALAALPAWRYSRAMTVAPATSRSRVAASITAAGGSLTAATGVRLALEPGGGRTSVPVRTTLLAAATAVALVTSVVVFSASLDHLLATPRLYGSAWDAQIELDNLSTPGGFNNNPDPTALDQIESRFVDVVDHSGSVADSARFQVGEVKAGAVPIPAIGYAPGLHGIDLTIAEGRAPTAPDEVSLGAATMTRLHTHIGATIELAEGEQGPNHPVTVVGRTVLPGLAPYPGSDKAGLGVGALLTEAGWRQFSSDFQKTEYVFRWAPGASVATLTDAVGRQMPEQLPLTVSPINHPAGVVSMQRLRATPTLLASLVALLLAAAVVNALVGTVRRRRRDLALLRTLGFTTGQILRTVLWQSTTVALVAVVLGLPAGIVIGRWTWGLLAHDLGTLAVPIVPARNLLEVAAAVFVLANVVAIAPGLRAGRDPAQALQAE